MKSKSPYFKKQDNKNPPRVPPIMELTKVGMDLPILSPEKADAAQRPNPAAQAISTQALPD